MRFSDWYTDRMDVFRVVAISDSALTRHERQMILTEIPCRIYRPGKGGIRMGTTAASIRKEDFLMCGNEVAIQAGDELLIYLGAGIGGGARKLRAFAGEANHYYEPFGAVMPGLAHQEIPLTMEEWVV